MITVKGNIWELADHMLDFVVIPTNIGWKKSGVAVMGRGIAQQAARRYPELPYYYGEYCQLHCEEAVVHAWRPREGRSVRTLILFPTKPLNRKAPHLSWRDKATYARVEQSLQELAILASVAKPLHRNIYIPDVGCGYGSLRKTDIRPRIEYHLGQFDRVTHVRGDR